MVFAAVFPICYLYHEQTQAVGKAAGLALLAMVMGVANEQTYNFLDVINQVRPMAFAVLRLITIFVLVDCFTGIPSRTAPSPVNDGQAVTAVVQAGQKAFILSSQTNSVISEKSLNLRDDNSVYQRHTMLDVCGGGRPR